MEMRRGIRHGRRRRRQHTRSVPRATTRSSCKRSTRADLPRASLTWTPTSGDTATVFTFTAQVSDDHDQPSAIQVRWDWNGDGTWDTSWSTTKTATHTFGSAGDYTVVVRAIDSGGLTTSKSRLVSVTAVPPPPIGTNPVSTQTQILLLLASVSTPIIIVTAIGVIVYAMNRLRRTPGRRD